LELALEYAGTAMRIRQQVRVRRACSHTQTPGVGPGVGAELLAEIYAECGKASYSGKGPCVSLLTVKMLCGTAPPRWEPRPSPRQ
jgi:hypothetical protein